MQISIKVSIIVLLLASCSYDRKNIKFVNCSTIIDTTVLYHDAERGSYTVNDSLTLSAGLQPFDKRICKEIKPRFKPLFHNGDYGCRLYDLYPPFVIVKHSVSDTLTVITKSGMVIFFQIPLDFCNDKP